MVRLIPLYLMAPDSLPEEGQKVIILYRDGSPWLTTFETKWYRPSEGRYYWTPIPEDL